MTAAPTQRPIPGFGAALLVPNPWTGPLRVVDVRRELHGGRPVVPEAKAATGPPVGGRGRSDVIRPQLKVATPSSPPPMCCTAAVRQCLFPGDQFSV